MYMADDLTRREYSYDPANPAKGVRIFAGPFAATEGGPKEKKLVLPQLLVTGAFASGRWSYNTGNSGEKRILVVTTRIVAQDSSYNRIDVDEPEITPETHFAQLERVLMCGTLYIESQTSNAAKVVDPYRSPILNNGRYDPDQVKFLNALAPELTRQVSLIGEIGVAYSLIAAYIVDVRNREIMTEGGFE